MKMKIGKSIVSMVLAAVMCLSLLPMAAFAADSDFVIENGVLTEYKGKGGNVVIPNSVTSIGHDVGGFTAKEHKYYKDVTGVIIPDSVTSIGNSVFYGTSIKTLTIPNSVTYIGDGAFSGCSELTDITIGTGTKVIDNYAFSGCGNLTSVTIPKNVESIGRMVFYEVIQEVPYKNVTIYGEVNTAAEKYALNSGIPFVAIDNTTKPTTPTETEKPNTANNDQIKVTLNGKLLTFDQPPIIENGSTLVPMRAIFEAMGATVEWNGEYQRVKARIWTEGTSTGTKKGKYVAIIIGKNELSKGTSRFSTSSNEPIDVLDNKITLDTPAKIINGSTFVPVRAIAESFDAKVEWNGETKTVVITADNVPTTNQPTTTTPIDKSATYSEWSTVPDFGAFTGATLTRKEGAGTGKPMTYYYALDSFKMRGKDSPYVEYILKLTSSGFKYFGTSNDDMFGLYSGKNGVDISIRTEGDELVISIVRI